MNIKTYSYEQLFFSPRSNRNISSTENPLLWFSFPIKLIGLVMKLPTHRHVWLASSLYGLGDAIGEMA